MYKFEVSQSSGTFSRDNLPKSKGKQSRQFLFDDLNSKESKQNDSKHMNAIKPYVSKQRKNSKKQIKTTNSQAQINRSRSKRLQSTSSNRKNHQQDKHSSIISCENISLLQGYPSITRDKQGSQITKIYEQMITLKSQYKQLKTSYNNLVREKQLATSRQETTKLSYQKETVLLKQEIEKYKKTNHYLESQIERIKKQCFKIIESEKFKYKKLQETLQQKQLMIAYLRKEIQLLKRQKTNINGFYNISMNNEQLNASMSQQDKLQRIFFLQNSAPIFSYENYARLSANTSSANSNNNVLIEQSYPNKITQTPKNMPQDFLKNNRRHNHKKKSQFQQDSLSFSRDKSKQFDSVHSLLSANHHNDDHTILTFTKKDVFVMDQSFSNCQQNINNYEENRMFQKQQQVECLTFENRKNQAKSKDKEIISFQSLKAKRMLSRSERADSKRSNKNSKQLSKRLQILTDPYPDQKQKDKYEDQQSCDTKKKMSKNKIKNSKKVSKSQCIHKSVMSEILHGSFIKNDSNTIIQSKSHNSNNTKRK